MQDTSSHVQDTRHIIQSITVEMSGGDKSLEREPVRRLRDDAPRGQKGKRAPDELLYNSE